MPFVAFGSFVVVNSARTQLRDSAGGRASSSGRCRPSSALEQYLARAGHAPAPPRPRPASRPGASPLPPARCPRPRPRRLEQAWAAGEDPKLSARRSWTRPLAARLKAARPRAARRSSQLQLIDTHRPRWSRPRLAAGGSSTARAPGSRTSATQEGEPEAYFGRHPAAAPARRVTLLEIAYPVRSPDGAWIGAVRALLDATDLYTVLAPVRVGRTGHASCCARPTACPRLGRERAHPQDGLPRLRLAAHRARGLPDRRSRARRSSASSRCTAATGRCRRSGATSEGAASTVSSRPGSSASPRSTRSRSEVAGRGRAGPLGGARPDRHASPATSGSTSSGSSRP